MAQTARALLADMAKKLVPVEENGVTKWIGVSLEGKNLREAAEKLKAQWGSKCCSSVGEIRYQLRLFIRQGDFVEEFDDHGVQMGWRGLSEVERESIAERLRYEREAQQQALSRRHQHRRGDYRAARRLKEEHVTFGGSDIDEGAYA